MFFSRRYWLAALIVALPAASGASAHVTIETPQAAAGAFTKVVMRVPHGCAGSATIKLRVRIPEGFIAVKPMPKPGWTLDTQQGPYDKTYEIFRAKVSAGVREVDWSGGRLPDDRYDEFVLTGTLASSLVPGSVLYFPTVQECETGVDRWIDIPSAGGGAQDVKFPAPALTILPPVAR